MAAPHTPPPARRRTPRRARTGPREHARRLLAGAGARRGRPRAARGPGAATAAAIVRLGGAAACPPAGALDPDRSAGRGLARDGGRSARLAHRGGRVVARAPLFTTHGLTGTPGARCR